VDDKRCRVTVVGKRRRVDLAVPANAPIMEYISTLTTMCGQESDDNLPAAWSLAPAAGGPFHPSLSLAEAKVVDGATLYLRDLVQGETDVPLITDVEELVMEANDRWAHWDSRHAVMTTISVGLGVVIAALAMLVIEEPDTPSSGLAAIFFGIGFITLAGFSVRRDWAVPALLRRALALSACPALALAGYAIPISRTGSTTAAAVVAIGVCIGALGAFLALLDVWTLIVAVLAVVALPVTVLLALLHATGAECAAVIGVVAFGIANSAPGLAGRLVTLPPAQRNAVPLRDPAAEIAASVRRTRKALLVLMLAASLILAGCLLTLGSADDPYAVGLAVCLSLGLLAQAGQNNVPGAVMLMMATGATGLTVLAIRAPANLLDTSAAATALITSLAGGLVLVTGILLARMPVTTARPRPPWLGSIGVFLSVLTVPLAVGVFGVFEYLATLGGRL
jgi:type VII secretion integral membrane protein EccD